MAKIDFQELIVSGVKKAQIEDIGHVNLYSSNKSADKENEFLFFLKPELTIPSASINLGAVLELVFEKIEKFGLIVNDINVIGADYLDKYNIIAQHYGVINKLAAAAKTILSATAREQFFKTYQKTVDEADVLGGIEVLAKYPSFTPQSLEMLWEMSEPQVKLAGGTYCRILLIEGKELYVINGFHPNQLIHFTAKGRSIVTMTLAGDLRWASARNNFIGATNPEKAQEGSLRRLLLESKGRFGLSEVSQGQNGVHLSAGPVEGLVELMRYNSDFSDSSKIKHYTDFGFGKDIAENFTKEEIDSILLNKDITIGTKVVSIFDLTEEADSNEALAKLRQVFQQPARA